MIKSVALKLAVLKDNCSSSSNHHDINLDRITMIAVSRSIFLGEPGDGTILVEHQYYESTKSVPVRHSGIWHPVKSVGRTS